MKKKQSIRSDRRPTAGLGGMLSLLSGTLVLSASIALMIAVTAPGCANQRLIDLQRGHSCTAEKVKQYATAHHVSYDQALETLRNQDREDWRLLESRQQKLPESDKATAQSASATVVPEKAATPETGFVGRQPQF